MRRTARRKQRSSPYQPDASEYLSMNSRECCVPVLSEILLRDNLLDHFPPVHVDAFSAGDFQFAAVDTQLVQHRRVEVGDVVGIFDGVESDFIRRAVGDAAPDAAAGEERGEAPGMVVAAGFVAGAFGAGG